MADALTIQGMIDANVDVKTIEQVATEDMIVTARNGREFPSGPMASRLILEQGTIDAFLFLTKADLDTGNALGSDTPITLVDDDFGLVFNDETLNNNGYYQMRSGELVWLNLNASKQALAEIEQAKQAAIIAAASDATTKANAAQSAAITASQTYADTLNKKIIKTKSGKNLVNETALIAGFNLTVQGAPTASESNYLSEFITVSPSTAYSFTSVGSVCFYDAAKVFISRQANPSINLVTPSNAVYMRFVVFVSSLGKAQIEQGVLSTPYEAYTLAIDGKVVTGDSIKNSTVVNSNIKDFAINADKLDDVRWLNMHNTAKLVKGYTLVAGDGTAVTSSSSDLTEYIPCRPNTAHVAINFSRVAFYDSNKSFISLIPDTAFVTPVSAAYMRFSLSNLTSDRFQVNEGTVLPTTVPQLHRYSLTNMVEPIPTYKEVASSRKRIYSFTDAWLSWKNGDKFPIAFFGDSTTAGAGTSGGGLRDGSQGLGYDYIRPNSYPSVFQALIREATGNTQMRAYNAGFTGTTANYGLDNFDEIFGSAYADAKMIGISFGINDRAANNAAYKASFLPKMEAIIQKCLDRNIQPFLLTTQPVTIPYYTASGGGTDIEEVANNYKRDLANKYNLEIVDINKYGEEFMKYSSQLLLNNVMENNSSIIHFGDRGHKYTAELLFAHFCKRVIWTYTEGELLDYSTQKMESRLLYDNLVQFSSLNNGFKLGVNKTQSTATNLLYQDFYVFNAGRKQLNLTAYYASAVVGQYVLVDGVQTTITTQGQALGSLDLGLHRIRAYSSATTALDWLGFKLQ